MAFSLRRVCGCSHERDAHQHYRRGTDCADCDCSRYRRGLVLTLTLRTCLPITTVIVPEQVEEVAGPYVRPTHMAGTGGRTRIAREPASPHQALPDSTSERSRVRAEQR